MPATEVVATNERTSWLVCGSTITNPVSFSDENVPVKLGDLTLTPLKLSVRFKFVLPWLAGLMMIVTSAEVADSFVVPSGLE